MNRLLLVALMAAAFAAAVVVGVSPSWEHHDIRPVACYDRPGQPC